MAFAPMRPCSFPRCPNLAHGGRCEAHQRPAWTGKHVERMRGAKLQEARKRLFAREPLCRLCQKRAATIRDHVKNLAEGGTDTDDNVQPVCGPCHRVKTYQESRRGIQRSRNVA